MIYLLLSIFCSASIFLIFKSFQKYNVNTFTAIVINYFIAVCTGFLTLEKLPEWQRFIQFSWLINSIILGAMFIFLFNVMAVTSQKLGASVASIANKMALIVPVIFAIYYYGDSVTILKVGGIILALFGVYFSTLKPKINKQNKPLKLLLIPAILFFGSGFIDTFIKYNQEFHLNNSPLEAQLFSSMIFLTALFIGLVLMLLDPKKREFSKPTIGGGLILGVINFGSIYFLIQTFNQSQLESSVVFPINNMGVVLLTTIGSAALFQEKFSRINKVGVAFSIISIILITLAL